MKYPCDLALQEIINDLLITEKAMTGAGFREALEAKGYAIVDMDDVNLLRGLPGWITEDTKATLDRMDAAQRKNDD